MGGRLCKNPLQIKSHDVRSHLRHSVFCRGEREGPDEGDVEVGEVLHEGGVGVPQQPRHQLGA